jgi:hypothetical protein
MFQAKFAGILIPPLLLLSFSLAAQAQTPVCPPNVVPTPHKALKVSPANQLPVQPAAAIPVSAAMNTAMPGVKAEPIARTGTADPPTSSEGIEAAPAEPSSSPNPPDQPAASSPMVAAKPIVSEAVSDGRSSYQPTSGAASFAPASGAGFVQLTPPPLVKKNPETMRPFTVYALGIKFDTLGAGIEIATPLSHSFNLRTGANFLGFAYPFSVDEINYNAELHFRSQQVSIDWFPEHHGSFHVSAGLIYLRNNLSALASVEPGHYFELGDQGFTNSVDDPLNGTAKVVYPHSIAPTLMMGFGNLLPRSGKHFSLPYEFGVAYTGAPRINVQLNGTACTSQGCFDAATNAEMQESLQQENTKLNNSLKNFPVYPILSAGLAYRF